VLKELFNKDLWEFYDKGNWIAITTNNVVKTNGEAVMGKGVALEAANKFPTLAQELGRYLRLLGDNIPYIFPHFNLITFPTKHHYREDSSLELIKSSTEFLIKWLKGHPEIKTIYMPRPGCGNGNLHWADVKALLEPSLDDRFIVVSL